MAAIIPIMEILLDACRQHEVAVTAFERFFARTEGKLKTTAKLSEDCTKIGVGLS